MPAFCTCRLKCFTAHSMRSVSVRMSSGTLSLGERGDVTKAHESAGILVPEREAHRGHSRPNVDRRRVVEDLARIVTILQAIIRNPRCDVMHVMQADASRDPLERRRQLEVRAAAQRGVRVPPIALRKPVRVLELVLHVKEPTPTNA